MRLETFTDAAGKPTYVNGDLITYIRPAGDEGFTVIYFGDDHYVTVKGSVSDVASKLFNAGKL